MPLTGTGVLSAPSSVGQTRIEAATPEALGGIPVSIRFSPPMQPL